MITRGMAQQGSSSQLPGTPLSDQPEASQGATQANTSMDDHLQQLPLHEDIVQLPAGNPRRRERPDLEDVLTQHTELLAAMVARMNQQQPAPQAAQGNLDDPPEDPAFQCTRD